MRSDATPEGGFEPPTCRLGNDCSILLSYPGTAGVYARWWRSGRDHHPRVHVGESGTHAVAHNPNRIDRGTIKPTLCNIRPRRGDATSCGV